MSETTNLKLFIHNEPYETNENQFDYGKAIAEPFQKIDLFAGDIKDKAGNKLSLEMDTVNYIMTLKLLNQDDVELDSKTIDFPLESVVVNGKYEDGKVVLTLQNGKEISFSVAELVKGLISQETFDNAVNDLQSKIDECVKVTDFQESQSIQDQRIEALEDDVKKKIEEYLFIIENSANTVSGEGESLKLSNTIEARFKEFLTEGNSKQEETPSLENAVDIKSCGDNGELTFNIINKNLMDLSKIQIGTIHGVTVSYNWEDQSVTLNGICDRDNVNIVIDNKTVFPEKDKSTLSAFYISGTCEGKALARAFNDNYSAGVQVDLSILNEENPISYNTYQSTNEKFLSRFNINCNTNTTFDNFKIKLMLTDNVDTDYMPHKERNCRISVQKPFKAGNEVRDKFININGILNEAHFLTEFNPKNLEVASVVMLEGTTFYRCRLRCSYGINKIAFCDKLKVVRNSNWKLPEEKIEIDDNFLSITLKQERLKDATTSSFKEFLNNNDIKVYVILTEPELIPCTPEQVEILNSLKSYDEITTINSDDEISPVFNVTAYAKGMNIIEEQISSEPTSEPPTYEEPSMEDEEVIE